jgi:hypothetical protein
LALEDLDWGCIRAGWALLAVQVERRFEAFVCESTKRWVNGMVVGSKLQEVLDGVDYFSSPRKERTCKLHVAVDYTTN